MKAAVFKGIENIVIEEVPIPAINDNEALLKVDYCGICGTDIKIYKSGYRSSLNDESRRILGHEVVGVIEKAGSKVTHLSKGMRVGIAPSFGCGICYQCISGYPNLCIKPQAFGITHDGGFAEYMLITAEAISQGNVIQLPEVVRSDIACLAEPLSCCINGHEAINIDLASNVLIIGAGPIGIMHFLLSKLRGPSKIFVNEINEDRVKFLRQFSPDHILNPIKENSLETIQNITKGKMIDNIIVAVSSGLAQQQAVEYAGIRGKILFFAGLAKNKPMLSLDSNQIHYKQLSIFGTTGSNVRQYLSAMKLISLLNLELEKLISEKLHLEQFNEGMNKAINGNSMKILIQPNQSIK